MNQRWRPPPRSHRFGWSERHEVGSVSNLTRKSGSRDQGLGATTSVDKVEIRWPDSAKETYKLPGVDRYFAIEEGKGLVSSVYDSIAAERSSANIARAGW